MFYKSDFDNFAKYFVSNGIAAFCYTFCGGSSRDQSGFETNKMTLYTEKEDLMAVMDELKSCEGVDNDKIYLFGASQGGMISALVAEDKVSDISGLILLFPAFCIPDDWNARFKNVKDIPETVEFWGMTLGRDFFEALHDFNIKERIGKYNKNVLIMHGADDNVVPLEYATWASGHYQNAIIEVFEKEGHGFSENSSRRMEAMTLRFIQRCMKKIDDNNR